MPTKYEKLNASRIKWFAYPIAPTELEVPEAIDTILRILALARCLELPVGAWVGDATRKDLNVTPDAIALLKANITDETTHDRAIKFALDVYPPDAATLTEAELIAESWYKAEGHPLEKPGLAETGVFMISLAVLYLCGGRSLFNLANNIATDEQRHVTTNRSVMRDIGLDPRNPSPHLDVFRLETLDWMLEGFSLPSMGVDKDELINASTDLIRTGKSALLQDLTGGSRYQPPFESSNKRLY